jgi:hypothetical protein
MLWDIGEEDVQQFLSPPLTDCVVIARTTPIAAFVIPGLTVVRQAHHPEHSRRGIQCFFRVLRHWMPDQVRHDRQNLSAFLNYDTVCDERGLRGGDQKRC